MADAMQPASFSNAMRARRFQLFERLVEPLPRPLRILDIGGTTAFWEQRGWADTDRAEIITVNIEAEEQRHANIEPRTGDATDLSEYADNSFDVCFSNSVIEHLFNAEAQAAMARETQRVGRAYWVQTPNFWFPIEPHFQVPGWQWLPESVRVAVIRRRQCGSRGPRPDINDARELVREVRLMRKGELERIFPTAVLWPERFYGLVQSWVAIDGFPQMDEVLAGGAPPRAVAPPATA